MQKQEHPVSCSLPPSNQNSKKPSMASQQAGRSGTTNDGARSHTDAENDPLSSPPEDFEFCILSSSGLALAGDDAAADSMCVADEVFSGGKLLPFRRLSSVNSADAPALALLRSDSLDAAATAAASTSSSGFSSRSVSRSASSGSNISVSRSTSSKSASSSDPASVASCPPGGKGGTAAVPPRRSLSGSVFYAHPSPSPRPPRRSCGGRAPAAAAAARRSTGSAPPASWGLLRLGVVGAPEVYAPRPAEYRKGGGGGSRSARLDQPSRAAAREGRKLALGILGAGLVCSCSPDAVIAPVSSAEVAAAEARRRKKKAEEKKRAAKQSGGPQSTAGRRRILEWLEELSISKEKSAV
ncbi:unnamed protein product [Urochloa decumbens]|uniref:Uncharacterized protein n=1 Tax=Urochloa decumbens TaxID=240449 RepID=A0ABC8Y923_9POAL